MRVTELELAGALELLKVAYLELDDAGVLEERNDDFGRDPRYLAAMTILSAWHASQPGAASPTPSAAAGERHEPGEGSAE
jgi:hypothetical protein